MDMRNLHDPDIYIETRKDEIAVFIYQSGVASRIRPELMFRLSPVGAMRLHETLGQTIQSLPVVRVGHIDLSPLASMTGSGGMGVPNA